MNSFIKRRSVRAFSLAELLVVIGVMALLTVIAGPAISSIRGAGSVNKVIGDLSGALQLARVQAISQHTYVRVALGQVAASGVRVKPSLVVLVIYSSDGTLDTEGSSDMADAGKWPAVVRALVMDNFAVNDSLGASEDDKPSASNIASFQRNVGGIGAVTFNSFIQFNPSGEARVAKAEPSHFIKIGVDRLAPQDGKNPFVLRLSGINGNINILRKENL